MSGPSRSPAHCSSRQLLVPWSWRTGNASHRARPSVSGPSDASVWARTWPGCLLPVSMPAVTRSTHPPCCQTERPVRRQYRGCSPRASRSPIRRPSPVPSARSRATSRRGPTDEPGQLHLSVDGVVLDRRRHRAVRRNAIVVFMGVELMLNATNLAFVTFARMRGSLDGQVIALFVMVVAAAEVVVGLAIIMAIFRARRSASVDDANLLKL